MITLAALVVTALIVALLAVYQPIFLLLLAFCVVMASPTLRGYFFDCITFLDILGIIFDILSML